jgi:hypothetical protein
MQEFNILAEVLVGIGVLLLLVLYVYLFIRIWKRVYPWLLLTAITVYVVYNVDKYKDRMDESAKAVKEVEAILRGGDRDNIHDSDSEPS